MTALASLVLPPGHVEQFCVADRIAFTTDFWGSVTPVCRRARGRLRNIRRPPIPSAVSHRTYAPNCGSTYWLEFRRHSWSNGCMGGSDNVEQVTWRHWGERTARAVGRAGLRGPCDPDCSKAALYEARARIRLDQVRHCSDQGSELRYFGRARVAVYMRPHNPFGYPTGWHDNTHKPMRSGCKLRQEDPLLSRISG